MTLNCDILHRLTLALTLGALGGFTFQMLGLPLAWMLGPMSFNLVAALGGAPVAIPSGLRTGIQVLLGVLLGSTFSPEMAQRAVDWPWSLLAVVIYTLVSTLLVTFYYRRVAGLDALTAVYSATPGGMNAMILMGSAAGGDERRIALAQSLRITLVVALVPPLVLSLSSGYPTAAVPVQPVETFEPWQMAWLTIGAGVGLLLARQLRLPAPELTGPMLVSATLYLTGWVEYHPPEVLLSVTLWILGSAVGVRFKGVGVVELLRLGRYALGAVVLALLVAAAFAALIAQLPGVDYLPALLALSPGGIAEMCLIAVAWHIDPAFVVFHHLARMLLVIVLAPWLGRLLALMER